MPETIEFAVTGNVAFMTGRCARCREGHLLRRDLCLEQDWSVLQPSAQLHDQAWLAASAQTNSVICVSSEGCGVSFDLRGCELTDSFADVASANEESVLGIALDGEELLVATSVPFGLKRWALDLNRWRQPSQKGTVLASRVGEPTRVLEDRKSQWLSAAMCYSRALACTFIAPKGDALYRVLDGNTCEPHKQIGWGTLTGVLSLVLSANNETLYVLDESSPAIYCFSTESHCLITELRLKGWAPLLALTIDRATNVLFALEKTPSLSLSAF